MTLYRPMIWGAAVVVLLAPSGGSAGWKRKRAIAPPGQGLAGRGDVAVR